ncbi:hypothetical protein VTL71DRAFT_1977 [Oculimacula yallundae]|uniref:2EXR domain-containing protein n=1 Tax=Oculimacula yallundae TaxID=86028 RepID=A0ABR4CC98_9HELO
MVLTHLANSTLLRLLPSSRSRSTEEPQHFHQFSRLPIELRLKIWRYAAYPRLVTLHLHDKNPALFVGEDRYEGYRPNWTPRAGTTASKYMDYPLFIPGPIERVPPIEGFRNPPTSPRHVVVTLCSNSNPCGCNSFPPKTKNSLPAPEVLLVCRESRYEILPYYRRYFEHEYDSWGSQVLHPISQFKKPRRLSAEVSRAGITFAPTIDALHIYLNVASIGDVMGINRFAGIVAKQIPDVQRVVLSIHVSIRRYRTVGRDRSQLWRTWGSTGWWVPVNHLVNMPALEEVVLVIPKSVKMLPAEWKIRTKDQWIDELALVEDEWPAGWKRKIPSLRFVSSVQEV